MQNNISFWYKIFYHPGNTELYDFFIQFYAYIVAGNDYALACNNIANDTENKIMKNALQNIAMALDDGETLSEAFETEDKIFPQSIIASLKAGEESGTVDTIIEQIIQLLEQEMEIETKISNAFLPIKISSVMFVLIFLMLSTLIIPRYEQMYAQKKVALPAITKFVFGSVHFINDYGFFMILGIVFVYFGFKYFKKEKADYLDSLKLQLPVYKPVYYVLMQYRIAATFITLLNAGMPVIDALQNTAGIMNNKFYSDICKETAIKIMNGNDFSSSLRESDSNRLIDAMIKNFITTGERNGSIPDTLERAKKYFIKKMDRTLLVFSNKVTILCLLPIGIFMLLAYIALFAPQYAIFQALQKGVGG